MAADYFSHEQKQRAMARRAWRAFESGLPKDQRLALKELPPAEVCRVRRISDEDDGAVRRDCSDEYANSLRMSCGPEIGKEEDVSAILIEDFGLNAKQAMSVARWHSGVVEREVCGSKSLQLHRIVSMLVEPMADTKAVIFGLALAAGLCGQMALNDASSGADLAKRLGKHRATLSYYKRKWQKLLDLKNETFGKSDSAKVEYRSERYKYVRKTVIQKKKDLHKAARRRVSEMQQKQRSKEFINWPNAVAE